ncbi:putative endonuclease [Caulobacter ginsengisoli]|uniref:Endonuclease n=1 Tax=Caulobacter ginsengisoli TaxID=400775 RepID=A0ABU0IU53_9CAUL|nr:GIY-YIG nuclease family protein [Caulobacter ginsengisoli]MDQ0464492.1 putative endonuclease [Caulobacter ginsengisoli]
MTFAVYIMASAPYGTLYIGSTDDVVRRAWQHREKVMEGFTKRYGVTRLVWFEYHGSREAALVRERQLKFWKRKWKIRLIEAENPEWRDLFEEVASGLPPDQPRLVLDDKPIPEPGWRSDS